MRFQFPKLTCVLVVGLAMLGKAYAQDAECQVETLPDWAQLDAGLPQLKPEPVNLKNMDVNLIAPFYNEQVKFRAAVIRGDYADAQVFWDRLIAEPDATLRMRQLNAMHFAMADQGLYFLSAAQAWVAAQPSSVAAKTFLGLTLSDAAKVARGGKSYGDTPENSQVIYKQRAAQARAVLQVIAARNDVYAWSAHIALVHLLHLRGSTDKAWLSEDALIAAAPQYGFSYFWAANYTDAVWASPDKAARRAASLNALAIRHQLAKAERLVLAQALDYSMRGLARNGDPQQARPYWIQRNKDAPHLFNLLQRLTYERRMENWPDVERLATQAIELNPYQTYSYSMRATANKAMGRFDTIFNDTVAAAVLGNNDAMSELVQGHVRGTLGFAPGNFEQLLSYCKLGTALGLPSAANCMGSAYTDGFASVKRDDLTAAAWHLQAARGGNGNSQHDVAVLLPRVSKHADVQTVSQHWMREAAAQNHMYAKQKATPGPTPEIDMMCNIKRGIQGVLANIKQVFGR